MLRVVTDWAVGRITYVQQLQLTMAVVLACGLVVMGLHAHITAKFPTNRDEINDAVIAQAKRMARRKELLSRSDAGVTTGCRPGLKTCEYLGLNVQPLRMPGGTSAAGDPVSWKVRHALIRGEALRVINDVQSYQP